MPQLVRGRRWKPPLGRSSFNSDLASSRHALKKMPISVTESIPNSDEIVFDQLPDDVTALHLKQQISEKYGFPVGEIRLVTVQGAKALKDEEVLAKDKRFQKLKMAMNQYGGCPV